MKARKIIIFFLVIFCLLLPGCGSEDAYKNKTDIKNDFSIYNVRMSEGVNSLNLYEKTYSTFYTNSKNIYITGRYENADTNLNIKFILKYNGKEISKSTLSCNKFKSDFRTSLHCPAGWKTGKYCVEIYAGSKNEPVKLIYFTVKASYKYSGPTVYITKTGAKYHSGGCRCLRKSKIPISLENAKKRGYDPCGICKPPR